MKSKKLIICILTILSLVSCNNRQSFKVEFNDANGLSEKSKIIFKGQTIGKIDKIGISDNRKIIVDLLIDKDFTIPRNHKFVIVSIDLLGSKAIELRGSDNSDTISIGEISQGENESYNLLDSLPVKIINIMENAASNQMNKQDSILLELRRLNKNLEELKNNK